MTERCGATLFSPLSIIVKNKNVEKKKKEKKRTQKNRKKRQN